MNFLKISWFPDFIQYFPDFSLTKFFKVCKCERCGSLNPRLINGKYSSNGFLWDFSKTHKKFYSLTPQFHIKNISYRSAINSRFISTEFAHRTQFSNYPVSTRRRFDVHTTSITLKRRRTDFKTTSCAYWVGSFFCFCSYPQTNDKMGFYCLNWPCSQSLMQLITLHVIFITVSSRTQYSLVVFTAAVYNGGFRTLHHQI